jgi:hypothetical protein
MSAISLPTRPDALTRPDDGHDPVRSARPERARRPLALLAAVALLVTLAVLVLAGGDAGAELADPVAGHVVVAPGETLWDVAVDSAPVGVDAREQLRAIQELNGLEGAQVQAWSVVLLPAR